MFGSIAVTTDIAETTTSEPKGDDPSLFAAYEGIGAIVEQMGASSKKLIMLKLMELLSSKDVASTIKSGVMPYIYAAGLLSFAGREINRRNLTGVVKSIGLVPDMKFVGIVSKMEPSSHLIYVYAFYFLLANGIQPTARGIVKVVESLGTRGDEALAREIFDFVSAPQ